MNPELKAKWVAALLSGEYRQGRSVLKDKDNNFCCLGVLYDLVPERCTWTFVKNVNGGVVHYENAQDGANAYLSGGFRTEVGIPSTIMQNLAYMNDDGKTFEQIAKYIELESAL